MITTTIMSSVRVKPPLRRARAVAGTRRHSKGVRMEIKIPIGGSPAEIEPPFLTPTARGGRPSRPEV
jgi:hypothetical protein